MKIHAVTLGRSPERFQAFLTMNRLSRLEIVRCDAVDGESLDRAALTDAGWIAPDLIFNDFAVGCALSHVACWRRAAEAGASCTICEDDAVLRQDFVDMHERLTATAPEYDLIYWGFNLDMHVAFVTPGVGVCVSCFDQDRLRVEGVDGFQRTGGASQLYRAQRVWGSLCYTVSAQGARTLLSRLLPLRNATSSFTLPSGVGPSHSYCCHSQGIDETLGVVHLADLAAYIAIPPLAASVNDKARSTIHR